MKPLFLAGVLALSVVPARAVDHNNIDAGRPLDFDDAESIAFREKTLDFGVHLGQKRGESVGFAGEAEFRYGFAPNSDVSLGWEPSYASQNGSSRRFNAGAVSLGVFHNFNREYGRTPAFSVRAEAILPTGRDENGARTRGVDLRLRGIASRKFRQFDRLHLNLDLNLNSRALNGERTVAPGLILGYSHPLGYPRSFTKTLVAQVGLRAAPKRGEAALLNLGVGMRKQVSVRSVLDFGVRSDVSGGQNRENLAVIAGYSTQF